MTFYNRIESVRDIAIDLTNGRKWRGASDKAAVFDALDAARREYMRLSDENAKLRELVRELWRTMDLLNACDVSEYDEPLNCIYCEQWGTVGKNIVGCKLKYRMRELGVEVDA